MFTLGGIEFQGWEIPDKLPLGGDQALVVHKTIGGKRVIHAMGPDDDAITWSARLFGETAQLRAFRLDLLRRAGRELEFRYANRAYKVVIKSFTATHDRPYLIDYSISLEVVRDLQAGDGGKDSQSIEAQVEADLAAARAYALGRDRILFAIALASTAIRAAMGDKQALHGLGSLALMEAQALVADAVFEATGDAGAANLAMTAVGGVGGVIAGGNPATMAANVLGTAVAAEAANSAGLAAASMTRVQANIGQAPA